MTTKTYWLKFPRFANEYIVGIASTRADAAQYAAEDFKRIDRDYALRLMSDHGDNATRLYATVTVDGEQVYDRFETARGIRTGQLPEVFRASHFS